MTLPLFWSYLRQWGCIASLFGSFCLVPLTPVLAQPLPPRIAAAANLNGVLEEMLVRFKEQKNQSIEIVYGASGNFYQQIIQGAQFDLFLSANEEFVDRLNQQGLTMESGVVYARGRIVLWVSPRSKVSFDPSFSDLKRALQDGRIDKFAIPNPTLAPYGLAATQSLKIYGLTELVQPRLVMGGDVGQTMLFLKTQSAQAGIVPLSMVIQSSNKMGGTYEIIPEKLHTPILQKMVLMKNASLRVKAFYQFLQTEEARKIWLKYGYE